MRVHAVEQMVRFLVWVREGEKKRIFGKGIEDRPEVLSGEDEKRSMESGSL
jgi:hypothetical protein